MAKPKQQKVQDNVPKSGTPLPFSGVYTKTPVKCSVEELEGICSDGLAHYGDFTKEAKQSAAKTAAQKKELLEKLIPWLRSFRAKLSRRGNGQWQQFFAENKKVFGGVTVRTANRWLGDTTDKPKFVCLDRADGITLSGKKYAFSYRMDKDQLVGFDLRPYETEEPVAEPYVVDEKPKAAQPESIKPVDEKKDVIKLYKAARKRLNKAIREFEPFSEEQVAANENDGEPWIDVTVSDTVTSYTGEEFQMEYDRLNKEFEDAMAAFKPIKERAEELGLLVEPKPRQSKAAAELDETLSNTETVTVFETEQNCDYSEQEVAAMFAGEEK